MLSRLTVKTDKRGDAQSNSVEVAYQHTQKQKTNNATNLSDYWPGWADCRGARLIRWRSSGATWPRSASCPGRPGSRQPGSTSWTSSSLTSHPEENKRILRLETRKKRQNRPVENYTFYNKNTNGLLYIFLPFFIILCTLYDSLKHQLGRLVPKYSRTLPYGNPQSKSTCIDLIYFNGINLVHDKKELSLPGAFSCRYSRGSQGDSVPGPWSGLQSPSMLLTFSNNNYNRGQNNSFLFQGGNK